MTSLNDLIARVHHAINNLNRLENEDLNLRTAILDAGIARKPNREIFKMRNQLSNLNRERQEHLTILVSSVCTHPELIRDLVETDLELD